jgi:hypothetical protein
MPPSHLGDAAKQRWISKKLANLGQELERHGLLDIRMSALEKKRHGGKLHSHALVSVPVEYFSIVDKWATRFELKPKKKGSEPSVEIYARVIDNVRGAILYMLKQHEFAGEFEKLRRGPWEKAGDRIKGQRVSRSKAALAILKDAEQRRASRKAQQPSIPALAKPLSVSPSVEIMPVLVEPVVVEIAVQQQQPEQIDIERWIEEHDAAVVEQPVEPVEIASTPTTSNPAMAPERRKYTRELKPANRNQNEWLNSH